MWCALGIYTCKQDLPVNKLEIGKWQNAVLIICDKFGAFSNFWVIIPSYVILAPSSEMMTNAILDYNDLCLQPVTEIKHLQSVF